MSGADRDELDDEAGLGAMRSVWREMRDEDPPARGMAELLAAARAQVAARPAPEPGWKRALSALAAAFRRPPVLAFATVVVLIGAGLLIGGTSKDEPAVQRAVTQDIGPPASDVRKQGAGEERAGKKEITTVEKSPDATIAAPEPPPQLESPPPRRDHNGTGATPRPMAPAPSMAPPPPPPPPPVQVEEIPPPKPAMNADETEVTGAALQDVPAAPQREVQHHDAQPAQPDLVQQCKSAAARGDCTTAKRLAGQVAKQNATAYRTMSGDAAVAKCLR